MSIALKHAPVTVTELQRLLKCTRDTALKYMRELAETGVFQMSEGRAPNSPSTLSLSKDAAYLKWGG
jgi:Fic family protein